jgi:hypothetical protein
MAVAAPAPTAHRTLNNPLLPRKHAQTSTDTSLHHSAHSPTRDHLTRLFSLALRATRSLVFLSRPSPSPSTLSPPRPATFPSLAFPESLLHLPRPPPQSQKMVPQTPTRHPLEPQRTSRPAMATSLPPATAPLQLARLVRSSPSHVVSAASF